VIGSGRSFRIEGAGILELSGELIAAERVYFDSARFLAQLGLSR
jgi:hypothetical protein